MTQTSRLLLSRREHNSEYTSLRIIAENDDTNTNSRDTLHHLGSCRHLIEYIRVLTCTVLSDIHVGIDDRCTNGRLKSINSALRLLCHVIFIYFILLFSYFG